MVALTRRHLLAAGGAGVATTALAACGAVDEPREGGRDAELLGAALAAETQLQAAYEDLRTGTAVDGAAIAEFLRAQERRIDRLRQLAARDDAGEATAPGAGGDETGLGAATAAANGAIAAYREGAGLLSAEAARATAMSSLAQVAAELAVLRRFDGENPAPRAFVTGGEGEPFVPGSQSDAAEEGE